MSTRSGYSNNNYQQHTMGYQIRPGNDPSNEYKVNHNTFTSSNSPTTIISNNSHDSHDNLTSRGSTSVTSTTTSTTHGAASAMLEMEITNHLQERRQRRLERNRESARQSRQKRKQFLEELEDNVCALSETMDKGRKQHVAESVGIILKLREEKLRAFDEELLFNQNKVLDPNFGEGHATALFTRLSRSSEELRIASMFRKEQLKSMVIPIHLKCMLWLTLQNDHYFRGGRAASERLSAARIGEKMLHSGNDCVPPTSGMWPLLCHEVSLSYDQEERMRQFQRIMLTAQSSWIERHTVFASSKLIETLGESINRVPEMLRRRETKVYGGLTAIQKLKFLSWANKNKNKVSMIAAKFNSSSGTNTSTNVVEDGTLQGCANTTSKKYHNAANLYILDRILQKRVLQKLPVNTTVLTLPNKLLKKLGCRPSFESLSSVGKENNMMSSDSSMASFASNGSLKRPSSSISNCDSMDLSPHCISMSSNHNIAQHGTMSPEVAQANAAPYVAQLLKPAGIIPYSILQNSTPSAPAVNIMHPISSLPPPPTPNAGSMYYQPEPVTSKVSHVMCHNSYPPPPPQQHRAPQYHQYPDVGNIMPYPVHCSPTPAQATLPVQSNINNITYQQYLNKNQHQPHHNHHPQSNSVPSLQQRQDLPMKSVPEEPDFIPVANNTAGAPHHAHTSSTTDFLLDLAGDWTIEGFDIELPNSY